MPQQQQYSNNNKIKNNNDEHIQIAPNNNKDFNP